MKGLCYQARRIPVYIRYSFNIHKMIVLIDFQFGTDNGNRMLYHHHLWLLGLDRSFHFGLMEFFINFLLFHGIRICKTF